MKPALLAVTAKIHAGAYPSVLEYGTLLFETGVGQSEARALTSRYADAIGGCASHEDALMASLRSFSLRRE